MEILKIKKSDILEIKIVGNSKDAAGKIHHKPKTAQQIVSECAVKPDYIINAMHFENSTKSANYGITISDTIIDGQLINGGNYNSIYVDKGIAFNNVNDMCALTTLEAKNRGFKYFCGGSPHIVWDSALVSGYLKSSFAKQATKRIGFGFNDTDIIIGFPSGNKSLTALANLMKSNRAKYAIAFDGGGSATVGKVSSSGKIIYLNQKSGNRACGIWLLIYLKKEIQQTTTKDTTTTKSFPKIYKMIGNWCNMRTEPNIKSSLATKVKNPAKLYNGDEITIFEIQYNASEKRYWGRSYGYWVAMEYFKEK